MLRTRAHCSVGRPGAWAIYPGWGAFDDMWRGVVQWSNPFLMSSRSLAPVYFTAILRPKGTSCPMACASVSPITNLIRRFVAFALRPRGRLKVPDKIGSCEGLALLRLAAVLGLLLMSDELRVVAAAALLLSGCPRLAGSHSSSSSESEYSIFGAFDLRLRRPSLALSLCRLHRAARSRVDSPASFSLMEQ